MSRGSLGQLWPSPLTSTTSLQSPGCRKALSHLHFLTRVSLTLSNSGLTDLSPLCLTLSRGPVLLYFRCPHNAVSPLPFLHVSGKAVKARSAGNPNCSIIFSREGLQKFPGQEGEFKKEVGEDEAKWLWASWWHKRGALCRKLRGVWRPGRGRKGSRPRGS